MRQFYTLPALKRRFTFKEQREHQNRILGSL